MKVTFHAGGVRKRKADCTLQTPMMRACGGTAERGIAAATASFGNSQHQDLPDCLDLPDGVRLCRQTISILIIRQIREILLLTIPKVGTHED